MSRGRGRPTKLSDDVKNLLLSAIAAGNHLEPACNLAGIDYSTFRNWMRKGEQVSKGEYFDFFQEVTRAIAQAEAVLLGRVKRASEEDWRAATWILERRYSDRWSNKQRIQIELEKELEKTLQHLEGELPPEIFEQVLVALADGDGSEADITEED
jgi:hypothetical protein